MKKSALIELLQGIEGDPDVAVWNGFVSDYMDIATEIVPLELVRIKKFMLKSLMEKDLKRQVADDELDKAYDNHKPDKPNSYFTEEQKSIYYDNVSTVYLLNLSPRGKTAWDRHGTIHY